MNNKKLRTVPFFLNLKTPKIMGILNTTPDSFYDGGKYEKITCAIDHVSKMISEGASIIDIGGESSRPGSIPISETEEMERVLPVIENIKKRFDIPISINSSKLSIIKISVSMGVQFINDIESLSNLSILNLVSSSNVPVCIMYKSEGIYKKNGIDILEDMENFFTKQIKRYLDAGILKNNIVLDPGFGFKKSVQENYKILYNLKNLRKFNCPVLVGISRKSMIGSILNLPVEERMIGSITANILAIQNGAKIVRVHDVKETMQSLKILNIYKNYSIR